MRLSIVYFPIIFHQSLRQFSNNITEVKIMVRCCMENLIYAQCLMYYLKKKEGLCIIIA